jgi:hypothetical protein
VKNEAVPIEDELMQGEALIRANFGINPSKLNEEQWAKLYSQAAWIEVERLKHTAELLAALFGEKK